MIKVRISPKYRHLSPFIEKLPAIFESEGRMMHNGRNVIKVFTLDDGMQINVKRYHIPCGSNLLIYSLRIRKPKGLRAYLYPQILLSRGIETPEAVAYIEESRLGFLGFTYFVSIQCPYEHTMYEMDGAEEGTFEHIAIEFGRFTARLHDREIMHMDYSPGNILYTCNQSGEYVFSLVDINRMYFGNIDMKRGLSNLKRLWGPKRFFIMVVREYARARGFDEKQAIGFALDKRRRFWERYRKRHEINIKLEL